MRPEMRDAEEGELHEGLGVSGCADPKLSEKEKAVKELREILSPGDTVYTVLRHVSRSGMTRYIDAFVMRDERPYYLSYLTNEVLGWRRSRKYDGVKVEGCGMDMGFHLVYSLSRSIFPDGFGEKCILCPYRATTREELKHCNDNLDEGVTPHEFRGRNGDTSGWDNDGGYALKQRWL